MTDRHRDRHAGRQADQTQTDRQRHTDTDIQTDRQRFCTIIQFGHSFRFFNDRIKIGNNLLSFLGHTQRQRVLDFLLLLFFFFFFWYNVFATLTWIVSYFLQPM